MHAYYLLKEPIDFANAAERARAFSVLRRLAAHLDRNGHAIDAARVLRLPGTFNFKHADPQPVTVLDQAETILNVSEVDDWLPREVARRNELVLDNWLREGCRNDTLYGVVRSLLYRGVPPRVITEALEVINNTWCAPPLPLPELMTLIRYAVVQGDRPDFAARHAAEDLVHDAGERVDERKPASLARARVQVRTGPYLYRAFFFSCSPCT